MDKERNFTLDEIRKKKPGMGGVYRVTENGQEVGFLAAGDIANVLGRMPEGGFDRKRASWEPEWGTVESWTSEDNLKELVEMGLLAQEGTKYSPTERAGAVRFSYFGSRFPKSRN